MLVCGWYAYFLYKHGSGKYNQEFSSNFNMKDMGEANVILGIKIIMSDDGLPLSQEHYMEKFLKKFGFYESNLVSTPYDANT